MPPKMNASNSNANNGARRRFILGSNGFGPRNAINRRRVATDLGQKVMNNIQMLLTTIVSKPLALVFTALALAFTLTSGLTRHDQLLIIVIDRLKEAQVTKFIADILEKYSEQFYGCLWFSAAFFASRDKNKTIVLIIAIALIFVLKDNNPYEFMIHAVIVYAFFQINDPSVRAVLVVIAFITYYFFMNKAKTDNDDATTLPAAESVVQDSTVPTVSSSTTASTLQMSDHHYSVPSEPSKPTKRAPRVTHS